MWLTDVHYSVECQQLPVGTVEVTAWHLIAHSWDGSCVGLPGANDIVTSVVAYTEGATDS